MRIELEVRLRVGEMEIHKTIRTELDPEHTEKHQEEIRGISKALMGALLYGEDEMVQAAGVLAV